MTPAKPVIDSISEGALYDTSETAEPLKVTATVSDAGTLSYQWYFTESQDGTPKKSKEKHLKLCILDRDKPVTIR